MPSVGALHTRNLKILEEYLEDREVVGNVTDETLKSYRYVITRFLAWLDKRTLADLAADAQLMIEYVRYLEKKGVSRQSISQYLQVLHAFFRRLVELDKIKTDPTTIVIGYSVPQHSTKPDMAVEVIAALYRWQATSETPERDTALVQTMLHGLMRVSEAVNLTVGDLIEPDFVHIARGKGRKSREVWVGKKVFRSLKKLAGDRAESAPLFVSQHGGAISIRTAQRIVECAFEDCGVNFHGLGSHWFRKAIATFVIDKAGGDPLAVSRQLGHGTSTRTAQMVGYNGGTVARITESHYMGELKDRIRRDFERAFRIVDKTRPQRPKK